MSASVRVSFLVPRAPIMENSAAAWNQRGEALARQQQALRLKPDFAEGHNELGLALMALGRLSEAEACFQEALRLRPAYAHAHLNLGRLLQDQGRLDEAVACYRQASRVRA